MTEQEAALGRSQEASERSVVPKGFLVSILTGQYPRLSCDRSAFDFPIATPKKKKAANFVKLESQPPARSPCLDASNFS